MSHMPRSAQHAIDKANAQRQARAAAAGTVGTPKLPAPPRRLEYGQPGVGMYEIFFDGVRQHLCTVADVDGGYITRFTKGTGNRPMTKETETLHGVVEIKRKGQKHVES